MVLVVGIVTALDRFFSNGHCFDNAIFNYDMGALE